MRPFGPQRAYRDSVPIAVQPTSSASRVTGGSRPASGQGAPPEPASSFNDALVSASQVPATWGTSVIVPRDQKAAPPAPERAKPALQSEKKPQSVTAHLPAADPVISVPVSNAQSSHALPLPVQSAVFPNSSGDASAGCLMQTSSGSATAASPESAEIGMIQPGTGLTAGLPAAQAIPYTAAAESGLATTITPSLPSESGTGAATKLRASAGAATKLPASAEAASTESKLLAYSGLGFPAGPGVDAGLKAAAGARAQALPASAAPLPHTPTTALAEVAAEGGRSQVSGQPLTSASISSHGDSQTPAETATQAAATPDPAAAAQALSTTAAVQTMAVNPDAGLMGIMAGNGGASPVSTASAVPGTKPVGSRVSATAAKGSENLQAATRLPTIGPTPLAGNGAIKGHGPGATSRGEHSLENGTSPGGPGSSPGAGTTANAAGPGQSPAVPANADGASVTAPNAGALAAATVPQATAQPAADSAGGTLVGGAGEPGTDPATSGSHSPADAALPSINTARVLQSMQGSEMRVGMHSAEFGNISVSTSVDRQAIAAQISFEHADLGKALTAHVPLMEARLSSEYGMHARVEVVDQSMGPTGESGRGQAQGGESRTTGNGGTGGGGSTGSRRGEAAFTAVPLAGGGTESSRLDVQA